MDYGGLRERVFRVNEALVEHGLVVLTWGNASEADRSAGVFAIKPSGVSYASLRPEDIVIVSLSDGSVIDGRLRPSSDTETHRVLYNEFDEIGGIIHTHSTFATSWAQAATPIPCFGTTHADHFVGTIPVTRKLTTVEIDEGYELNTGRVIVEHFREYSVRPLDMPAVLLPHHGPFVWGVNAEKALENSVALEEVAHMAYRTLVIHPSPAPAPENVVTKHYSRKHGPRAYYGQG